MRDISLFICMDGIRSCVNGWFILTKNLSLRGRLPPTIFAQIDHT